MLQDFLTVRKFVQTQRVSTKITNFEVHREGPLRIENCDYANYVHFLPFVLVFWTESGKVTVK